MRSPRLLIAGVIAVALTACGHHGDSSAQPTLPPMLIDDRGVVMPLEQAVTKITYKPWVPPGQVYKFAVIPPLGDLDTPDHRGVAVEFQEGRQAWLLSEWPKQNFVLLFLRGQDITFSPCKIVHYKSDGVAWTSHGKLAMTLQPDGTVSSKDVEAEARRLIAAGACN